MKNNVVVKSNQVTEAGYDLSTNEQRLILLAISKIPKKQEVSPTIGYEITAHDFAEAYDIHPKTSYRELKEATSKLYERSLSFKNDKKTTKVRWVNMITTDNVDTENAGVTVYFSEIITPYLTNLKDNFTRYLLSDISNITGSYTIRFYELICQYRTVGKREINIDELRFMLRLGDKYTLFADFKKRVIEPSIAEINEKTPMKVEYTLKRKGKKVESIMLKFKDQRNQKQNIKTLLPTAKNNEMNEQNAKVLAQLEADKKARLEAKEKAKNAQAKNDEFILYFESLPSEKRSEIFEQVNQEAKNIPFFGKNFNENSYKDIAFRSYFKKVMGMST